MTTLDNTQVQSQAQVDTRLAAAFPPGFLWGSATASYQVEGATHEDGRSLSIWDQFAATPGKTFQGDTGDIADDHYHRMPQDVALMAELGLGAYRFSLAWPRILPQGRGLVNSPGLDFYDRLVDTLLAHGIKPFATLYHWDLPIALEEEGGWVNRDTAYAFAEYAEVTARRLGDRVEAWITLNEPWCSAFLGYGIGVHAPGLQNRQAAFDAGHNLLLAHGLAVPRIRASIRPGAQVGITLNFTPQYAADERPETLHAIERADAFSNRWFLDPIYRGSYPDNLFSSFQVNPPSVQEGDFAIISAPIDFLGVNYYSRSLMQSKLTADSENHENSESGGPHEGAEAVRPFPAQFTRKWAGKSIHRASPTSWYASTVSTPFPRFTSLKMARPSPTSGTGKITSAIPCASSTCTRTSRRRPVPSRQVCRYVATSSGRCSTTLSGEKAIASVSVSSMSITPRSAAFSKTAPSGIRASSLPIIGTSRGNKQQQGAPRRPPVPVRGLASSRTSQQPSRDRGNSPPIHQQVTHDRGTRPSTNRSPTTEGTAHAPTALPRPREQPTRQQPSRDRGNSPRANSPPAPAGTAHAPTALPRPREQPTHPPATRPPARGGPTIREAAVALVEGSSIVGPPLAGGLFLLYHDASHVP